MGRPRRFSPEVRERAVRMVQEHGAEYPSQWAAIVSRHAKLPRYQHREFPTLSLRGEADGVGIEDHP